jgi:hypothetical protein
MITSIQDL